jgi:hypothetical protein
MLTRDPEIAEYSSCSSAMEQIRVSQLDDYDLYQGRDDLREFIEATREEARRKGTKWDDAESAGDKSTSKWSRIRYQQLFGKKNQDSSRLVS